VSSPSTADLARYRDFSGRTARKAGALVREKLKGAKTIRSKSADMDLVTETDVAAEKLITAEIRREFPDHGILGEESTGNLESKTGFTWIIDPIDGTTNFAHGHLIVGVSIGLAYEGRPVAGCVYCPALEEEFLAAKGLGATLNGEMIRVSNVPKLSQSLLASGFPYDLRDRPDHYLAFWRPMLMTAHGVRRLGSASIDLCWVAAGRLEGYWEENLKAWDIAAGIIILEEAGGRVSDFSEKPHHLDRRELLATNGVIHSEMARALREVQVTLRK